MRHGRHVRVVHPQRSVPVPAPQVAHDEAHRRHPCLVWPTMARHAVLGTEMHGPWPDGHETALLGLGCFWGAERRFWTLEGVHTTAVGYAGGVTDRPSYRDVCRGDTMHAEVVLVVFDPARLTYGRILAEFWESHDPTQGMRQGNDVGTQYRSAVYWTTDAERRAAEATRDAFQTVLTGARFGPITTEIATAGPFHYAEPYHQQYLAANPGGYCGLGGTGQRCPTGVGLGG
ncbi:MAG: peptide-methionine (S)-S-oxide reductase MsrA [Acidimicrobiia bacterium]